MGMKSISAGYEFAHRDDYEGRHVIPDLNVDVLRLFQGLFENMCDFERVVFDLYALIRDWRSICVDLDSHHAI